MALTEKLRKCLDTGGHVGSILTDSSKAFDCNDHELLVAKLFAYGFGTDALKLIYYYFRGSKKRTKINSSISSFAEIVSGLPHVLIFGYYYLILMYVIFFTI